MPRRGRAKIELPPELIFQILIRLPSKSLCRFRAVCKLWHSTIGGRDFVEAHYALSASHPKMLMFFPLFAGHDYIGQDELWYSEFYYSIDYPRQSHDKTEPLAFLGAILNRSSCSISHPVDGLLCLGFRYYVKIFNPATQECFEVITMDLEGALDPELIETVSFFGFDPIDKKHKVLTGSQDHITRDIIKYRVFVLEENRRRTLYDYPPHNPIEDDDSYVTCINGVMFYTAHTPSTEQSEILVAFDVRSERFQIIPLPEEAELGPIIDFSGCATLVTCNEPTDDDCSKIILWILEDPGRQVWRRKICVLPQQDDHVRILDFCLGGATPMGELILQPPDLVEPYFFLLYNVESNSLRRIEIQGLGACLYKEPSLERIRWHVESMQSPKGISL